MIVFKLMFVLDGEMLVPFVVFEITLLVFLVFFKGMVEFFFEFFEVNHYSIVGYNI